MSRVGKKPIPLPKDVHIEFKNHILTVKGPKGELSRNIHPWINVHIDNDQIALQVEEYNKKGLKSLHGLFRALVNNMVTGVTAGFEKTLEIVGVGYRVELSDRKTTFHLGYSHPVIYELPEGVNAKVEKAKITLSGIDKELLGKTAAEIRGFRRPEPYKGKGIRYAEEIIKRKAGKSGAK
jgi:large subunit ribosomal protein L6